MTSQDQEQCLATVAKKERRRAMAKRVSKDVRQSFNFFVVLAVIALTISCVASLIQTDEHWGNAYNNVYNDVVSRFSFSEPTPSWREEDGVIYFSVTSDGTTGEEWIGRLEDKGFRVDNEAKQVLRTPSFKPTSGVTYEVVVFMGRNFYDNTRTAEKIRESAKGFRMPDGRRIETPNAELTCFILEKFMEEEIEAMGLRQIIVMHEPINGPYGDPYLLAAGWLGNGHWLGAFYGGFGGWWPRNYGFAFVASPASTEATAGKQVSSQP